jgi:hypothetical protein
LQHEDADAGLLIDPSGHAVRALAADYVHKHNKLEALLVDRKGKTAQATALQKDLAGIAKEQDAYKQGWANLLLQAADGREALAHDIVHGLDIMHGRPLHTKNTTTVALALLQDETIWSAFNIAYPGDAALPSPKPKSAIVAWMPSIVRDLLSAVWKVLTPPVKPTAPGYAWGTAARQTADATLEAIRYLNLGELQMGSSLFLPKDALSPEDLLMMGSRTARSASLMQKFNLSTPEVRDIVRLSQVSGNTTRNLAEQIVDLSDYIAAMASPDPFCRTPMSGADIVRELTKINTERHLFRDDIFAAAMRLCAADA